MAVVARTATSLADHKTSVVLAASPGTATNVPDGDTFPNGGDTIVILNNTGGVSYYVDEYIDGPDTDGNAVTPLRHTVAAGVMRIVKLGPPSKYGNPTKLVAENTAVKIIAYAI